MAITEVIEAMDSRGRIRRVLKVQSWIGTGSLDDPRSGRQGLPHFQLETGELLNHDEHAKTFTVVQTGEVLRYG